jgi:hypothetical protein
VREKMRQYYKERYANDKEFKERQRVNTKNPYAHFFE